MRDPALNFIIVLLIGIVAGVIFERVAGPGWLARQFAGPRRMVTAALVGIAGAFIGFHLTTLVALAGGGAIALYIGAAIGAAIVLYAWRAVR